MSLKILVGIPVLYNDTTCLKAFRSVIEEADVLIIDNGAEDDVKQAIRIFKDELHGHGIFVIENEANKYVNPAWNQILKYFLDSEYYDQLIIMNSDLIMHKGWSQTLVNGISCVSTGGEHKQDEEVFAGTPGIAIHLNKEMAKLVYPLPKSIKIWFGDQFIYEKIRKAGYKTIIRANWMVHHWHNGSQTCQKLPEFQEIIAQDKLAWLEIEKTL